MPHHQERWPAVRRTVRGETSERVAEAELTAPATRALAARAGQATSLVEVHRLVTELRELPGVRDARLESAVPGPSPFAEIPVGPRSWRLALRVRAAGDAAYQHAMPAIEQISTAAERCLTEHCRALGA